jgi:hypothetical protein
MPDFKNNNGFGQLFPNSYKNNPSQPDHKGKFTDLAGDEWEISAWEKEGRNGPFLSLGIQKVYVKPESKEGERPKSKPIGGDSPPAPKDFDDDIPF